MNALLVLSLTLIENSLLNLHLFVEQRALSIALGELRVEHVAIAIDVIDLFSVRRAVIVQGRNRCL